MTVNLKECIKFINQKGTPNRKVQTYMKAIGNIMNIYRSAGFLIRMLHMDPDFECLRKKLLALSPLIELNITSKGEHVPEIERRVRVIKEK